MNLIVTGLAGSGKSSLVNLLIDQGFHYVQDVTDRPKRPNELGVNKDHIFVSAETWSNLFDKGCFCISRSFKTIDGDYRYGYLETTWRDNFETDTNAIAVMGPALIMEFIQRELIDEKTTVIFDMDTNAAVCRERMKNRGDDMDEINRRISRDMQDLASLYDFITCQGLFDSTIPIDSFSAIAYEKGDPVKTMVEYLKDYLK